MRAARGHLSIGGKVAKPHLPRTAQLRVGLTLTGLGPAVDSFQP